MFKHLFSVDDIKLFTKDGSELNAILNTVKCISDDIRMDFRLEKCSKVTFKKRGICRYSNIT